MLAQPPLRLAMDERMLLDAQTGVATYARSLRNAQKQIAERPILIADRAVPTDPPPAVLGRWGRWCRAVWPLTRTTSVAAMDLDRQLVSDLYRLAQVHFDLWKRPLRIRITGPAGIVHWSYPLPIEIMGWRNIYTVHDTIPLSAPSLTPIDSTRHRRLLEAIAENASAFATVSGAAKNEIGQALGAKAPRIINCGQAVFATQAPSGPLPTGLSARGYLLVIGAVERRKNLTSIVEAHSRSGVDMPLVVVGPDGWGAEELAPLFDARNVVRLPYLPAEQLRLLLAEARALLMVSLAEGFGLPIAEAMVLGTPVITSNLGAQAETAGQAALLVDPASPDQIAAAIQKLTNSETLWTKLAALGRQRAAEFSPAKFEQRLAALYRDLN